MLSQHTAAETSVTGKVHLPLLGPAKQLPLVQHGVSNSGAAAAWENNSVLCSDFLIPQASLRLTWL